MVNTKSLTISRFHQMEDCEPLPEEVVLAARAVVCSGAVGDTLGEQVAEAELFMHMLGIYPGQEAEMDYLTGPAPVVNDPSTRLPW
jgi:hypothetical protein